MNAIARRAGWGFFDQALSSGSNFALSAFVAASVSARAFGAFALVYAIYNVIVGLNSGLVSIPLIVRYSAAAPAQFLSATRASVGAALALGTLGGIGCLAVAPFTDASISAPLQALGVTLPGLLAQDAWRYSFVTGGRPARAAANDGLWIVLQLIGIGVVLASDSVSALSMVLVWGGSGCIAAAFGCWQTRALPQPSRAIAFLREQRRLTLRYGAEVVIHRSGSWIGVALIGAVGGLQVAGALRAALLLSGGPLNLLFVGATIAIASEGVRLLHRSPGRLPHAMRMLSVASAGLALAWSGGVLLMPDSVGARLLGASWHQAKPLLPTLVVLMVALGAALGPIQGMLSLGAAKRSLFTQSVGLAVNLPAMTAGALLAGAPGAALAAALTAVFRTVLAWIQFGRAVREPAASLSVESGHPVGSITEAGIPEAPIAEATAG